MDALIDRLVRLSPRITYRLLFAGLVLVLLLFPIYKNLPFWPFVVTPFVWLMFLTALVAASRSRAQLYANFAMVVAYFGLDLMPTTNNWAALAGAIFFSYVVWVLGRDILTERKQVTSDTIYGAVSVYLLLGLCWAFYYGTVMIFVPHALGDDIGGDATEIFENLLYFSLVTLSTLGYGDITPVAPAAHALATAEAVTGQLYLTVLVARLVGMHIAQGGTAR